MQAVLFFTTRFMIVAFFVAIILSFSQPVVAHAGLASQLVPCGNDIKIIETDDYFEYYYECNVCDLAVLGMNILNFLIVIMVSVAALIFVNAGWLYITSPGNSGNIARAHKMFTSTLMGILIILVAYLLIDTIMRTLISGNLSTEANVNGFGPWNEILCIGDTDYYKIKKLDAIELTASNLVLPPTKLPVCSDIVPGASCQVNCVGAPIVGTSCADGTVCCAPSGTVPDELNDTCSNPMSINGTGICLPWSSCDEGAVIDEEVCGTTMVCCPATKNIGTPDGTYSCTDYASLAEEFGGAGPVNGPGLDAMIACYKANVGNLLNQAVYTYDRSHPTCNYTNGREVCESCSHSYNSCHYGRGTGLGALAADFNADNDYALSVAMKKFQSECGGRILYESVPPHVHVSLAICP